MLVVGGGQNRRDVGKVHISRRGVSWDSVYMGNCNFGLGPCVKYRIQDSSIGTPLRLNPSYQRFIIEEIPQQLILADVPIRCFQPIRTFKSQDTQLPKERSEDLLDDHCVPVVASGIY